MRIARLCPKILLVQDLDLGLNRQRPLTVYFSKSQKREERGVLLLAARPKQPVGEPILAQMYTVLAAKIVNTTPSNTRAVLQNRL